MSSNPDLVPFDEADSARLHDTPFPPNHHRMSRDEVTAKWLTAAFGGKPRPPRTHAVTVEEYKTSVNGSGVPNSLALQEILGRKISFEDYDFIFSSRNTESLVAAINERFGLTPAPETDDEKWERIRREGLTEKEASEMAVAFWNNCAGTNAKDMIAAFRKVLGVGAAGA